MRSTSPAPSPFLRPHPYQHGPSQSTWFLRTTAISASWLALAGYTLFSLLVSPSDQLRWSTDVLASLGGIALTSGYVGGLMAYYFARSIAFRLDSVVLPLLLSSVGGLFAIVVNWALHQEVQTGSAYLYAPLGVACVSTVLCAGAALFLNTQRKIHNAVAEAQRRHVELTGHLPNSSSHWDASVPLAPNAGTPFLEQYPYARRDTRHSTPHYPEGDHRPSLTAHRPPLPYDLHTMPIPPPLRHMSSTELRPIEDNIPSDEAQRRQLLRLLIAKEQASDDIDAPDHHQQQRTSFSNGGGGKNAQKVASGTSSTYRIDWPGSPELGPLDDNAGRRSQGEGEDGPPLVAGGAFTPPPASDGQAPQQQRWHHRRSSSSLGGGGGGEGAEISNRWSIGNLLGGGKRKRSSVAGAAETGAVAVGGNSGEDDEEIRLRREREVQRAERERRRREIERSSIVGGGGGGNQSGAGGEA